MDQTHDRERPRPIGTVAVVATGACGRLVLTGDIDVTINAELCAAVAELERLGIPIEVHTHDVTSIDSSLIASLASLVHRCDLPITLVDPPGIVRYLVQVAELADAVAIVDRRGDPAPLAADADPAALLRARDGCSCAGCRADLAVA